MQQPKSRKNVKCDSFMTMKSPEGRNKLMFVPFLLLCDAGHLGRIFKYQDFF